MARDLLRYIDSLINEDYAGQRLGLAINNFVW
jgi:hypothetical protein